MTVTNTDNHTIMAYLLYAYPIVMSCGLGGTIMGALYFILNWIYRRFFGCMWSTITINHDDESFKLVIRYLQDKKLLSNDNVL